VPSKNETSNFLPLTSTSGRDTLLINNLYKVHYLQWLGRPFPDTILGVLGIVLLLSLSKRKINDTLPRRAHDLHPVFFN